MANQTDQMKNQLLAEIDTAWVMLHSFLANLSRAQKTTILDPQGWSVKDHITHLTAWEEMVVYFLQGKNRFEPLGVERSEFESSTFDEQNALIKDRRGSLLLSEANAQFQANHRRLVALLTALSDADLNKSLDTFHPDSNESTSRLVIEMIRDNTSGHFSEHLGWIEELVSRPA